MTHVGHKLRLVLAGDFNAELLQEGIYGAQPEKSLPILTRIRSNGKHLRAPHAARALKAVNRCAASGRSARQHQHRLDNALRRATRLPIPRNSVAKRAP